MKKLLLLAVTLCCMMSLKAQITNFSIIPHIGGGVAQEDVIRPCFIFELGVDGKYHFTDNWALLAGIDYQNRATLMAYAPNEQGEMESTGFNNYFRLPIRAEFSYRWFYVNLGAFIERATNPRIESFNWTEDFAFGVLGEMGGRIRITDLDRIRLGFLLSIGGSLITDHDYETPKHLLGHMNVGGLISVGYEHRF